MPGEEGTTGAPLGGRPPRAGIILTLAGIAVLALTVVAIEPLRAGLGEALRGDTEALREDLRGLGAGGALIVLGLALLRGAVQRGGVTLLLAMRLVPIVPFSLLSYVAGAAHVRTAAFMWTTGVGYLPLTAVFVYVGSRLDSLSLTDPILWFGAILLIALLLLGRRVAPVLRQTSPARIVAPESE